MRPVETSATTKRTVLSQAVQLFDPVGWLALVVVCAKIFFQSTWLQGLDCDFPFDLADVEV